MERVYEIVNGTLITLKLEEDPFQITFWDINGNQLGQDEDFVFYEPDEFENSYLLGRMYVPIKGEGLGRVALELFTEYTQEKVYAREHDGIVLDDGSHLTEDAPGFVNKMIEEGLLINNRDEIDFMFQ